MAETNTLQSNTRYRRPRNRPAGEEAVRRVRAHRALELRIGGAQYRAIATTLGVSLQTAYADVQAELGRLDAASQAKVERLRQLEAHRLDRWQLGLAEALEHGDPRARRSTVLSSAMRYSSATSRKGNRRCSFMSVLGSHRYSLAFRVSSQAVPILAKQFSIARLQNRGCETLFASAPTTRPPNTSLCRPLEQAV